MNEIKIRKATSEDAAGIAKVQVETWKTAYKGLMPDDYLNSLSAESKTAKWKEGIGDPKDKTYLVAELNGEVVGFCIVGPTRDEDANKEIGELYAIYVLKSHAGNGIGSKLMTNGLEILVNQGFKEATLWVLDTNSETRKWYESKGWTEDGKTKIDSKRGFDLHETRYRYSLSQE